MKTKIFSLLLVSMLLLSFTTVLASAEQNEQPKTHFTPDLGKVHVDASAVLRTLGYTEEDETNVPSKLMVQIIRSYDVLAVQGKDGDYYLTITPDSPRAEVNLIGTDRISPYDLDLSNVPNAVDTAEKKDLDGNNLDWELDQRAALCFGIWDYPGDTLDLPEETEDEFNALTSDISSTSAYDYWHFMTNDDCTWYNIWAWTTWACETYRTVDIYWNGHGTEVNNDVGFVSYDAWDDNSQSVVTANLYFPDDFTTGTYDYSTLRVGLSSFCYGLGFSDTFLDPGGDTTHTRVFMGSDTVVNVAYALEYVETFGDTWYHDYENSEDAHDEAADAADTYLQSGENPITYQDTGDPIWFR